MKYRIVKKNNRFYPQYKLRWWPFWIGVVANGWIGPSSYCDFDTAILAVSHHSDDHGAHRKIVWSNDK